jgi:CubicO group peptidase (beta-lactamase class C family)
VPEAAAIPDPEVEARLARAVETQWKLRKLPGLAALAYSSEGLLASAAAGVRRVGDGAPLRPDDRFHVGSLTKALTALLVATLVDEGRLAWTTRVLDVLPELAGTTRPSYRDVTVADLLDHRAGIRPWTNGRFIPRFEGSPVEQRLAATARLLSSRPVVRPGRYRYSNGGYTIAAALAEHVGGRPWEELMRTCVFTPLGIRGFVGWPLDTGSGQPSGHVRVRGRYRPVAPAEYRLPPFLAPAGDITLSLAHYAKFGQLHLRAARGLPTEILSTAAVAGLQPSDAEHHFGWQAGAEDGVDYIAGEGSAGTFFALSVVVPSADRGVIVIANAGSSAAQEAALAVALDVLS